MPLDSIRTDALTTTGLGTWNFDKRLVGDVAAARGVTSNKFASAKSILVCAGPERSQDVTVDALQPIGLLQDFNMQQNVNIQEIFEIGSRGKYFIQGRPARQVSMSRLLFNGPSLMRAMYRHASVNFDANSPANLLPGASADALLFLNLASKFFERPCGLLLRIESMETGNDGVDNELQSTDQIGAVYLEECYIRTHALSLNANQVVVGENVTLTYDDMVPMA